MPLSRRSFAHALTAAGVVSTLHRTADAQAAGIFQHGVASGDPLVDRVVLWTRVTVAADETMPPVEWLVAEDPQFNRVVQRGLTTTSAAYDYTVKVDVPRLKSGTTYYYRFTLRGTNSPVGRTKTLPAGTVDRLRFAVVSCSNYPYGFFNAYRMIANRTDLDCVFHLGDYIYEYAEGQYGTGAPLGRGTLPNKEIITLSDYRQRYAQYRSDPDLQEVHRQHAFINVWDDHETANDAWRDGAQNHQPATDGDWAARRGAAAQAYFEWLPVRENVYEGGQIYRTFRFGDLADFVMLDTRLAGRDLQVAANSPLVADPNRTLLGWPQEDWLLRQLTGSRDRATRWRLLGQQVMMGQLVNADGTPVNTDQWDGYLMSRNRLLSQLSANRIDNVIVLSGDIHSSWGNEIAVNPFTPGGYTPQAVEFVTPAVTSPGIDDLAQATALAAQISGSHPHIKYVNLFRRGYLLVDLTRDRAQAEWYHVQTITQRLAQDEFARGLQVAAGANRLITVTAPSSSAAGAAAAAP